MKFRCAHCGKRADKLTGEVNRARKAGLKLYCNRLCSGFGRRSGKTKADKAAEKKVYDAEYRNENRAMLKAKKHEYFKRTYDPVKAAADRQKTMPRHVDYCRRAEYRAWKKSYDRIYKAKESYGPFWECQVLTLQIRETALEIMSDYEIRMTKGTLNKRLKRKREYERSFREELEVGSLGNLELGQGWQNGGLASGLRRLPGSRDFANDQHPAPRVAASEAPGIGRSDNLRGDVKGSPLSPPQHPQERQT